MAFENINFIHVLIAGVATWILGAVYYTLLGKPYGCALGASPQDMENCKGHKMPMGPFVLALLGALLMAYVLAALLNYVAPGAITLRAGMTSAFFVWLGFTLPPMIVNNAFTKRNPRVTLIDGVYWLLALLLQGAILGALMSGTLQLPF